MAHGQPACDNMSRPFNLLNFRQTEQSTGMTHFQVAVGQHGLDDFRQGNQAQQVGHCHPGLAHSLGHLLLGQLELLLQPLQGHRFFNRVQVFALNVLDQRDGDRGFIGYIANHCRDGFLPGLLAGAPAAFAGNDFKAAAADRANHDGLHDALGLDRLRQLFERLRIHVTTRLVLAALEQIQGEMLQLTLIGLRRLFFQRADSRTTQQSIQSTSETSFLDGHGDSLSCLSSGDA
ncbi:hypothetical protein EMIT0P43_70145 [Pseudomonas jessenii]